MMDSARVIVKSFEEGLDLVCVKWNCLDKGCEREDRDGRLKCPMIVLSSKYIWSSVL